MTTDLQLVDLSRLTRTIVAGRSGFVALFADDGRVLGVPHVAAFDGDAQMQAALMKPVQAIGVAPLALGVERWRATGSRDGELLRYEAEGVTWLASLRRSHFGTQTFWVATMAPEADFSPGTAAQASGPSAGWGAKVQARVRPNIVFTDDNGGNPEAVVDVRLAPDGTIVSKRLTKSSGHRGWDEAVLRALERTEVLPRDTDGRVPPGGDLVFRPRG